MILNFFIKRYLHRVKATQLHTCWFFTFIYTNVPAMEMKTENTASALEGSLILLPYH